MAHEQQVTLARDVSALMVPWGTPVTLQQGENAAIVQQLGDTFTLWVNGNLYRVEGENADALGVEAPMAMAAAQPVPSGAPTAQWVQSQAWEKLRTCYDPEIPINIVDLGLIYDLDIFDAGTGQFDVEVRMTLTAPGCGMGDVLAAEVGQKLQRIPGVRNVGVSLVFDPPWSQDRMSEVARLESGLL